MVQRCEGEAQMIDSVSMGPVVWQETLTTALVVWEMHPKIKNTIVIYSISRVYAVITFCLLSLQPRHITNKKYVEMLGESQNRIKSMALIYEKLYQSEHLADIDFSEYIMTLAHGLGRSYRLDTARASIKTGAENISLDIDTAILCELTINELVFNALKHVFLYGKKGEIEITVGSNDDIKFLVSDKYWYTRHCRFQNYLLVTLRPSWQKIDQMVSHQIEVKERPSR